jgi:hypothetical protein
MSPMRYELSFYIPEDDIFHSPRRENLKSYIVSLYREPVRRHVLLRSLLRLLVTAIVVPSLLILVTLMIETIRSSETSDLTRVYVTSRKTAFFTDIDDSSGVQTHDPSIRSGENSSFHRLRDHCDRLYMELVT